MATWDRVLIQVWRGDVTADAMARQEKATMQFIAEQGAGQKIILLSVIEPSSPPPPDHVRKELARYFRDVATSASDVIIVPEGGGFRPALVRSVGVALSTFAPRVLPFRFIDSVPAACALVAPRLSPSAGGARALEAAVEQARARIPGSPRR